MDKPTRNTLRNTVTQCRRLLEAALGQELAGRFGIYATGAVDDAARMGHLSADEREYRELLLVHLEHIRAGGFKPADAVAQLVREVSFTHLNRLVAYKMMEARGLIREAVSRGPKSQGFLFYLADHPEDEALWSGGQVDRAYRHFLTHLGATFADQIPALFSQTDPANRLYPPQRTLDEVLALINGEELAGIWGEDETIGWVYQYFTPKELRDQARKESQAPRNSYELAFRNQFYTPRYVVEFLTDNTLGRIWYEMRQGQTALAERCRYMVRRPGEVFLGEGETERGRGGDTETGRAGEGESEGELSQEELLRQPAYIPHRARKDPREIQMLDPAGGSGHFGLYCFDLYEIIYQEAYDDPELGKRLRADYPDREAYRRAIPGLILAHNIHIIDIDPRACQIAALALWLRGQRAYQELGLKPAERPKITRANVVCAEPMPGERELLAEFAAELDPPVLGQLVAAIFDKMKLAGEAGSLLKIEEEIQEVIAQARKQWIEGPPKQLALLPDAVEAGPVQLTIFDLSGVDDEAFWAQAEGRVLDALRDYAERAAGRAGLRRRLFADDAAQGFAFIDLCRKKYDVVLMNPPFGEMATSTKSYMQSGFPDSSSDIYTCFVDRAVSAFSASESRVGVLSNRTFLTLGTHTEFRRHALAGRGKLEVLADLGSDVLDSALVEVAAYVVRLSPASSASQMVAFLPVHSSGDKNSLLLEMTSSGTHRIRYQALSDFAALPNTTFAYWLPDALARHFRTGIRLEGSIVNARVGLQTSDDFRFARLRWEVDARSLGAGKEWVFFAKGGEFSPYYDDVHLVVKWGDNGREIKSFVDPQGRLLSVPRNQQWYFRPGLTYPWRTSLGFAPRILPVNCIFAAQGSALLPLDSSVNPQEDLLCVLGALNSSLFQSFISIGVGAIENAARSYQVGLVQSLPWLEPPQSVRRTIVSHSKVCVELRREFDRLDETSICFCGLSGEASGLRQQHEAISHHQQIVTMEIISHFEQIDQELEKLYDVSGLIESNRSALKSSLEQRQASVRDIVELLVSQSVGCVMGRWDVRALVRPDILPNLQSGFAPLPVCPPAGLIGPEGLPATSGHIVSEAWLRARPDAITLPPPGAVAQPTIPDSEYPLRIAWDGILVDDPDHPDDIVRRVRDVLELLWGERAAAIEQEACEILGVSELRDYFRKPAAGGFWLDHVRRYSKSRRKAPIYWLLQSSKKNYALWLYYHRLDKDLLFKALVNTVEPKIRLEEGKFEGLRGQRATFGAAGREAKQLERQLDRQEAFLAELHDFRDKLRRAADLRLEPDLNDGVILNIAPLWELVPWREAKATWEELLAGKYEWSSVGQQLRARGLVK